MQITILKNNNGGILVLANQAGNENAFFSECADIHEVEILVFHLLKLGETGYPSSIETSGYLQCYRVPGSMLSMEKERRSL